MDPQIQQLVQFFTVNGTSWVKDQRARYRPSAIPLDDNTRRSLQPFFSAATLDSVRVLRVPEVENPGFYAAFVQAGQPLPLDFRQMAGITFGDVVLVSTAHAVPGESPVSLMFHELVHVVQYSNLGIDEFIRRYVIGWAAAGFDYYQIPLEQDAYTLQNAFDQGVAPTQVELDIVRRLGLHAPAT